MDNNQSQIQHLEYQMKLLIKKHSEFSQEIQGLSKEILLLKNSESNSAIQNSSTENLQEEKQSPVIIKEKIEIPQENFSKSNIHNIPEEVIPEVKKPRSTSSWEKFIGENLINKIGILITVIGVAIGAKYSIENGLISPLTRIILGYISGAVLLGIGMKLKQKYLNYSAVLVSGAIAIMYFITFFAYSFYGLIPNLIAFVLMFIFTVFTIFAALKYDKQIIAHIGLVGAYAVPLLLSDGSGKVEIMLTYIAIINVGILILSFKKYWKPLFYSAFGLTWIFAIAWFIGSYEHVKHFSLAAAFFTIYFITFYLTFLAYKLLKKEQFEISNIVILLLNSFIFYGLGYGLISYLKNGEELLGLFTLANALIHFVVSVVIYKKKLADRNLFYLVSGLVLVFITLAVPVQLNGNWVTLIWIGEAALLFWIGRTKKVPVYEKLSYVLMAIAVISLLQDWSYFYESYYYQEVKELIPPIFNIMFFTSFLFIVCFGFINFISNKKQYESAFNPEKSIYKLLKYSIPGVLIGITYFAFRNEIELYWNQLYQASESNIKENYTNNYSLMNFKNIWVINYSLFFISVLGFLNFHKLRNDILGNINRGILLLAIIVFLTLGLLELSELRESYLEPVLSKKYATNGFYIWIRYVSFAFVALALFVLYQYNRMDFMKQKFPKIFDCLLHICILWIASSELIHCLDLSGYQDVYKLGLSILWGVYSLLLIALGIWKKKQYFRIGAIALFAITLIKLFFYDISELGTGSKTILFVALGVLLLIISFLYNKYKHLIFDEDKNVNENQNED